MAWDNETDYEYTSIILSETGDGNLLGEMINILRSGMINWPPL